MQTGIVCLNYPISTSTTLNTMKNNCIVMVGHIHGGPHLIMLYHVAHFVVSYNIWMCCSVYHHRVTWCLKSSTRTLCNTV